MEETGHEDKKIKRKQLGKDEKGSTEVGVGKWWGGKTEKLFPYNEGGQQFSA